MIRSPEECRAVLTLISVCHTAEARMSELGRTLDEDIIAKRRRLMEQELRETKDLLAHWGVDMNEVINGKR